MPITEKIKTISKTESGQLTDICTVSDMMETLIGLVEAVVIGTGKGAWKFERLGKENSVRDIVAHAHIFLSGLRDERGLGSTITMTQRCFNGILADIQEARSAASRGSNEN